MKKTIGILAHVDAGKTTFSEQVLHRAGAIRALGRVDHRDAFLDAHPIERARGITVFSDQAAFELHGDSIFWLDTPGHVDFSPEMERAIAAMDYAVLIVSCAEGVQSHTETVWHLLERRGVPVFFFLNKTDRAGADKAATLAEIKERLTPDAVELESPALVEAVAERDESLIDRFLAGGHDAALWRAALKREIRSRAIFPVLAGAALTGAGIDAFLNALTELADTDYDSRIEEPFSARVYKIRHDPQGARVCFFKVLSGRIRVREELDGERITELRRYHGARYKSVPHAEAGELCAAVGLNSAKPGDMLGAPGESEGFSAEPMLRASVNYPPELRKEDVLGALREIEDEEPTLSVQSDGTGVSISVMGEVQLEVLAVLLKDRFGMDIAFGEKRVLYQETIATPGIGIGHFEPLRHYAEVHVRVTPGERGSGVRFQSRCHVDILPLSWQRLVETHVFETRHRGVLINAPLTDVTVELLTGRHHLKHTEGGDFREATYRAIRCALMNAESVLLEPWCAFALRAPTDLYGRIMGDLTRMRARCEPPAYTRDVMILEGEAAFREISGYGTSLTALSHGRGILSYRLSHYEPAREPEKIIAEFGNDRARDDSADSVFCQKGAGFNVKWHDVPRYAHCPQEYRL